MTLAQLLVQQMIDTRDWTLKLLADLQGDDWTFQPGPGMAHALWMCGHLAFAQNGLIHIRCMDTTGILDESFVTHFPIGVDVLSANDHDYPPIEDVLTTMKNVQGQTLVVVEQMSDDFLAQPAYAADGKSFHPHYKDKGGAVSHCIRHEAFHAGQIATIRRLLGKSFLR